MVYYEATLSHRKLWTIFNNLQSWMTFAVNTVIVSTLLYSLIARNISALICDDHHIFRPLLQQFSFQF